MRIERNIDELLNNKEDSKQFIEELIFTIDNLRELRDIDAKKISGLKTDRLINFVIIGIVIALVWMIK